MTFKELFTSTPWWGKFIGAALGYLVRGPIGAFFGLLIGNFFDQGLANYFSNPHLAYHTQKKKAVQKLFFEATFAVMGHIAKSDGHVSVQEIKMAKTLMKEMRLTTEQKELAKYLFNEGKLLTFRLDMVLKGLLRVCRDNRELLKLFVDIQYRAAQVDGLTLKKIQILDSIFTQLGFAPLHQQYRFYEDFGSSSSAPPPPNEETVHQESKQNQQRGYEQTYYNQSTQPGTLDHAYALLEVSPRATKQEVKKAYRRLLSKNHPDKLIAQGLPEAMIKIANEKTHRIMKAYEFICQTNGWL